MDSRKALVLISVSCGIFFEALDIAIVNLAIPLIQQDFSLPADTVQWMQTVYVLFYGGFLILGGKLADSIGRKKIFLIGSGIFLMTSAAAGFSTSFVMLCVLRGMQGLGAAFLMPAAFSIVTTTFQEPGERNKAIGIFGSFAAIGSGSGLSLGGLIATWLGWQWIFLINVPVIFISMVIGYLYISPDGAKRSSERIDVVSAVALTIGILLFTFVIHDLRSLEEPINTLTFIAVIILCFSIFIRRSQLPNPLIPFGLFHRSLTWTGLGVMMLMGAVFTGFLFMISMVMQSYMNFTAAQAGLILVPFSIVSAFVSKTILPRMLKRMSMTTGGIIGMMLMTGGALSLLFAILADFPLAVVLLSVAFITGTGIAVCFLTLNVIILQGIPEANHGLASSMANTSFFFGGGIGLSILGALVPASSVELPWAAAVALTLYGLFGAAWLWIATRRRYHAAV